MRVKRVWQFYALICETAWTHILKYWQGSAHTHTHREPFEAYFGETGQLSAPCLQLVWWLYFQTETHTHALHTSSSASRRMGYCMLTPQLSRLWPSLHEFCPVGVRFRAMLNTLVDINIYSGNFIYKSRGHFMFEKHTNTFAEYHIFFFSVKIASVNVVLQSG